MRATSRPADATDAGRSCPYCRFPLKAGSGAFECGDCRAVHHADCWAEGEGCAVVGCAGRADDPTAVAPAAGTPGGAGYALPSEPQPQAPNAPPPTPVVSSVPAAPGRPWLALSIALLALVLAGSAGAFLLTQGDDPAPQAAVAATTAREPDGPVATTTAAAAEPAPPPTATSGPTGTAEAPAARATTTTARPASAAASTGPLPDVPRAQMSADITTVMRDFHEAVADRRFESAWALLSDRRRAYEEREEGYAGWQSNQTTVADNIGNPRSIRARVLSVDRADGSAQIYVSGPTYSGPCGRFSGKTWAKFEDGSWHYDPGYAIAGRRAVWQPRQSELLLVC